MDTGRPIETNVLAGMVFVAVIAQAVPWFAGQPRDDWHIALRAMRLRAKCLPD